MNKKIKTINLHIQEAQETKKTIPRDIIIKLVTTTTKS